MSVAPRASAHPGIVAHPGERKTRSSFAAGRSSGKTAEADRASRDEDGADSLARVATARREREEPPGTRGRASRASRETRVRASDDIVADEGGGRVRRGEVEQGGVSLHLVVARHIPRRAAQYFLGGGEENAQFVS